MEILNWLNGVALLVTSGFLLLFAITSLRERERRAVWLSLLLLLGNGLFWAGLIALRAQPAVRAANRAILVLPVLFVLTSLLRFFPAMAARDDHAAARYDERDHMFSRDGLKCHPELASRYYGLHPESRAVDDRIHSQPDLGAPGRLYHDPLYSPIFGAAFAYLERTRAAANGTVASERTPAQPEEIRSLLLRLARYYGAVDAGIAALRPLHFYSHRGRRAEGWGEPIDAARGSAVVVVVAMDWKMIARAPSLPAILESSRQYVEAAKIAMIIAEYLRSLGYRARAHTDGNYEALCVPLAVDAGLGELGRLGILIHPVYGPCVRLAAVTTELELPPTGGRDFHADSFCRICRKCAENCPPRAIAAGAEPVSRGFRHWSVNQEKCYGFWKQIGSDCAVCIRSCPYAKPDSLLHRLVRFYVSRNPLNQRLALFMDDLFYGRKKRIAPVNAAEIISA